MLTCDSYACSARYKVRTSGLTPVSTKTGSLLTSHHAVDCLNRNGFDESKCQKLVDALYECCNAFYEKNGDSASTVSCPKANLLRLKMEQRKKAT